MDDTATARELLSHYARPDDVAWLVAHPADVLTALQPPWIYVFPTTLVRTVQCVPTLRDPVLTACVDAMHALDKALDRLPSNTGMQSHFLGNQWCAYHQVKDILAEMTPCVHPGCSHLAEPPRVHWERRPPIEVFFPVCEEHLLPGTYEVID